MPLSLTIAFLAFLMNMWVLFFRFNKSVILSIVAFPSIALLPYMILAQSFIVALNLEINRFIFSVFTSIGLLVFAYLLILTANILNTARFANIPLEQAGKASQFIFSLIAVYLMLIFVFGTNYNLLERLVLLVPLIIYFSYSAISLLKVLSKFQILVRTLCIGLIMLLALLALSIWPLDSVYSMLAGAIFFYILLSIALEVKSNLTKYVWMEFLVLSSLISILLLTNAFWGINGSLL
jgi:hypothetical protein